MNSYLFEGIELSYFLFSSFTMMVSENEIENQRFKMKLKEN
jgi:hypothetical protein